MKGTPAMMDIYQTIEDAKSTRLDRIQRNAEQASKVRREGTKAQEQQALTALLVAVRQAEAYVSTETE